MAVQLTQSDEYYANFVTAAYEHYLGRAPDAAGLAGWVQGIASARPSASRRTTTATSAGTPAPTRWPAGEPRMTPATTPGWTT